MTTAARFELALERLKPSDWERFERLASAFLAGEYPNLRTKASPDGDGGRDATLFAPSEDEAVALQFSVTISWEEKIRETVKKLNKNYPDTKILLYVSNQLIGAKSDNLKKYCRNVGIYLDVLDRNWFLERLNSGTVQQAAAAELAAAIVDPLLSERSVTPHIAVALESQDAKTAFFFLELQWQNELRGKGLTKSSFEALVRAALHDTNSENRITKAAIYQRIGQFLPRHSVQQLQPYVDAALNRLGKSAVKSWPGDEYCLSHDEATRLSELKANRQILDDQLNLDILEAINIATDVQVQDKGALVLLVRHVIEAYFLKIGEEFAASVSRGRMPRVDIADLKSVATSEFSKAPVEINGRQSLDFVLTVSESILLNPSDRSMKYLKELSDIYTLFSGFITLTKQGLPIV